MKKPFELFFTIDVKECICIESANYARLKTYHGFKMILCKLKFIIGFFTSWIQKISRQLMYRDQVEILMVFSMMTLNEFVDIKKCFHLNDNFHFPPNYVKRQIY